MWFYIKLLFIILSLSIAVILFIFYSYIFIYFPDIFKSKSNLLLNGVTYLLSWALLYLSILNLKNLSKNKGIKK